MLHMKALNKPYTRQISIWQFVEIPDSNKYASKGLKNYCCIDLEGSKL